MENSNNPNIIIRIIVASGLLAGTSYLCSLFIKDKKEQVDGEIVKRKKELYEQNQGQPTSTPEKVGEDSSLLDIDLLKKEDYAIPLQEYKQKLIENYLCDADNICCLIKSKGEALSILQTFFESTTSISSTVFLSSIAFFCLTYKSGDDSSFENRTRMFDNLNNYNDSPIVKDDTALLNRMEDNNGELNLIERFSTVGEERANLEKLIISFMETKNRGEQSRFLEELDATFLKAEITPSERNQIYLAALNLKVYKSTTVSNLVLNPSKMSPIAKVLAIYVIETGKLTVPKKFNSVFDTFTGESHFARND